MSSRRWGCWYSWGGPPARRCSGRGRGVRRAFRRRAPASRTWTPADLGAGAPVGDVLLDLPAFVQRAPAGLHQCFDRGEDVARLPCEVAAVLHAPVLVIRDLPRQKQDRLSSRHPDALAIPRRVVHADRAVLVDLRHGPSPPLLVCV